MGYRLDALTTGSVFSPGDNPFGAEPGAETRHLRMRLAIAILASIKRLALTQRDAAARVPGLTQADVSQITRGKLRGFSEGRLIEILLALGTDIELRLTPTPEAAAGRVRVVEGPTES